MQAAASLCMLTIAIVTFVVGARLFSQGAGHRKLPELAFGTAFLAGSLGAVGAQLGQRFWWTQADEFALAMNATCFAIQVVGTLALFFVTWRVFRPNEGWGFMLCAVGSSFTVLAWIVRWMDGDFLLGQLETPGIAVYHAARVTVFAWCGYEALHYHGLLKRRMTLGLADPIAAQQIFMWGVSAVAAAGVSATIVTSVFGLGRHPLELPGSLALLMLLGLTLSACMWCAFFPPEPLRRRARGRAAASV